MNQRRIVYLVLVMVLLLGCGPAAVVTQTIESTQEGEAQPTDPSAEATPGEPEPAVTPGPPQPVEVRPQGFGIYVPVTVDVVPAAPAYDPDLGQVVNPDLVATLTEDQRARLEENGFVVVPQGYQQIYEIYKQAKDVGMPVFVTTDAVLHAYHVLYDYTLRLAEMEHFIGDLEALNVAMLEAAQADYGTTTGVVQEAAWQNVAFFAVATKLLTPDRAIPAEVQAVVAQELALIEDHAGFTHSPIFGYPEDYSQYVPRGHYTRNEDFERYFRAMMWYGRMSFHLVNPRDPAAARRETRGALLIVRALYNAQAGGESALDVWDRIYETTAFFVGTADDLTVYDYAGVAQQVYGGLPDPTALFDQTQLERFVETARQLRPPAIVGGYVTDQEDSQEVTMGFRFMGQRFIPDSYVFQQLVYDQVTTYQGDSTPFTLSASDAGPVRGFPRGLDVPAVLGSERALEILTAAGDTQYIGYDEQLAKLQAEFADLPESQWTENLYWNWLHTLRPLLEPKGEGYPAFMQASAWADKDLHTWLGSWTELRHDTILYAKQSYAVRATGLMPDEGGVVGYVEPQPEVYARLVAVTVQMRSGLNDRGLLGDELRWKLLDMENLLRTLKTISEKELRGEALSEEEYRILRDVGNTLEGLTTFSEEIEGQVSSQTDERMALVADVHTDTNTNQVLEEAVGDAFPIYVVALVEEQQVVTVGGVFSYYEFKQPMGDRLTDESWQAMSPRPDRPAWTASFVIE